MPFLRSLTAIGITLLLTSPAMAAGLRSLRSVNCDPGRVSDCALDSTGRLYVCYPDAALIAQYGPRGELLQYIRREAGVERPFRPASCVIGSKDLLHVFDEASREVLVISPDGNQQRSYPLAWPVQGQPLALSRIGHLLPASDGVWALLPDRASLSRFDSRGVLKENLALGELLPYAGASYSRAQWLGDGTLFVLDYNQGAVLYRPRPGDNFRRLSLGRDPQIEAQPQLQDFAVDPAGNALLLNLSGKPEAVLLRKGSEGYTGSDVTLPAALSGKRLGCRGHAAGFLVWSREGGIVWLCAAS